MLLLIDLQGCQSESRFGGIGRYSMSLAKAMLQLGTSHKIRLLLNSRLPNENFIRAEFAGLMPQQDILTFEIPPFVAAENELPAHTRMAELIREKRIAEIDPDVLHIASLFEGAGEDVVTSVGMLFPTERTAVTLYDLIPYLEQEIYLTNPMLSGHYLRKFEALKRAGMIVSISEFSRREALEHTDIPADRIANISSAVDGKFGPLEIALAEKSVLLAKSGIKKPFLLFTGSFDVRKNHERLVQAFAMIPAALREKHQLVIIGKGKEQQVSKLRSLAQEHGLSDNDLVFVGHVTDSDLVALYNLCSLFVFPSLREGFGLPVLEAMSCGAPTIGSNRTSVPEVIGRADALFDPEDVGDMAEKITSALSNSAFHKDLRRHGLKQARNFSWELSARRALAFFESKIDGTQATARKAILPSHATSPPVEDAIIYENFLAALSKLPPGKLDADLLASSAQAIAANELRTRIDAGGFRTDLRIAWVTNWNATCERAVRSRQIIEALPSLPTIFAPHSAPIITGEETNVIRCWNGGKGNELSELHAALERAPIDVVVIDCVVGLFELPALAKLVTQQKGLSRHVFVMLDSAADLSALTIDMPMLEIRAALKSCDGIFVNTMVDAKILEGFKVRKNVNFLPNQLPESQIGRLLDGNHGENTTTYFLRKLAFAITRDGS